MNKILSQCSTDSTSLWPCWGVVEAQVASICWTVLSWPWLPLLAHLFLPHFSLPVNLSWVCLDAAQPTQQCLPNWRDTGYFVFITSCRVTIIKRLEVFHFVCNESRKKIKVLLFKIYEIWKNKLDAPVFVTWTKERQQTALSETLNAVYADNHGAAMSYLTWLCCLGSDSHWQGNWLTLPQCRLLCPVRELN